MLTWFSDEPLQDGRVETKSGELDNDLVDEFLQLAVVDGFVSPFLRERWVKDDCSISFAKLHSPCTSGWGGVEERKTGLGRESALSPKTFSGVNTSSLKSTHGPRNTAER